PSVARYTVSVSGLSKAVSAVIEGTPRTSPAGSSSNALFHAPPAVRRHTAPLLATATTAPATPGSAAMRRAPAPSCGAPRSGRGAPPAWARSTWPDGLIDHVLAPPAAAGLAASGGLPGTPVKVAPESVDCSVAPLVVRTVMAPAATSTPASDVPRSPSGCHQPEAAVACTPGCSA